MSDETTTDVRCPKCRSGSFSVDLVMQEGANADFVDGVRTFIGQSAMLAPVSAEATCSKCGHAWRVRDPNRIPVY